MKEQQLLLITTTINLYYYLVVVIANKISSLKKIKKLEIFLRLVHVVVQRPMVVILTSSVSSGGKSFLNSVA